MKQTAVQWLVEKLMKGDFVNNPDELIEQAKAMEKEQIMDAYEQGESDAYKQIIINIDKKYESFEQYYKETYETI
jgi:hypothetical protein